jgi:hypothetical protein
MDVDYFEAAPNFLIVIQSKSIFKDTFDEYIYHEETPNATLIKNGSFCFLYCSRNYEHPDKKLEEQRKLAIIGYTIIEEIQPFKDKIEMEKWIEDRGRWDKSDNKIKTREFLNLKIKNKDVQCSEEKEGVFIIIPAYRAKCKTFLFGSPLKFHYLQETIPEFRICFPDRISFGAGIVQLKDIPGTSQRDIARLILSNSEIQRNLTTAIESKTKYMGLKSFENNTENNLEKSEINSTFRVLPTFLTFLFDKWEGISTIDGISSTSRVELLKFYKHFNLSIKIENDIVKFYNFFTRNYITYQTFFYEHIPRRFGCYWGIESRVNCEKLDCDQRNPGKTYKCDLSRGNIWVQQYKETPIKLASNYISVIFSEVLKGEKIDIHQICKIIYKNEDSIEKFINDFHINEEEFKAFFNLSEDQSVINPPRNITHPLAKTQQNAIELQNREKKGSTNGKNDSDNNTESKKYDFEYYYDQIIKMPLTCSYKLILLYGLIKIHDNFGTFQKEDLVESFISFYKIRMDAGFQIDLKNCNPLQEGDKDKILPILMKNPVKILVDAGFLANATRFSQRFLEILKRNKEKFVTLLWNKIIKYYETRLGDSQNNIEKILNKWGTRLSEITPNQSKKEGATQIIGPKISFNTLGSNNIDNQNAIIDENEELIKVFRSWEQYEGIDIVCFKNYLTVLRNQGLETIEGFRYNKFKNFLFDMLRSIKRNELQNMFINNFLRKLFNLKIFNENSKIIRVNDNSYHYILTSSWIVQDKGIVEAPFEISKNELDQVKRLRERKNAPWYFQLIFQDQDLIFFIIPFDEIDAFFQKIHSNEKDRPDKTEMDNIRLYIQFKPETILLRTESNDETLDITTHWYNISELSSTQALLKPIKMSDLIELINFIKKLLGMIQINEIINPNEQLISRQELNSIQDNLVVEDNSNLGCNIFNSKDVIEKSVEVKEQNGFEYLKKDGYNRKLEALKKHLIKLNIKLEDSFQNQLLDFLMKIDCIGRSYESYILHATSIILAQHFKKVGIRNMQPGKLIDYYFLAKTDFHFKSILSKQYEEMYGEKAIPLKLREVQLLKGIQNLNHIRPTKSHQVLREYYYELLNSNPNPSSGFLAAGLYKVVSNRNQAKIAQLFDITEVTLRKGLKELSKEKSNLIIRKYENKLCDLKID